MNGISNQSPPIFVVNPLTGLLNQIPQTVTINTPTSNPSSQGNPTPPTNTSSDGKSDGGTLGDYGRVLGKKQINKNLIIIISVIVGLIVVSGIIGLIVFLLMRNRNTTV
jgi:hypothetical protein